MTYLHRFTKKCHLLSVTARLVLMLLVGMLGITTPTAPALASDDGIFGNQCLDDPRPVSGRTGIPPAGPVWAIASDVLAYDNQGPDGQRSTVAATGSAIMPETISAGGWYSCGLSTDGSVACWGRNDAG